MAYFDTAKDHDIMWQGRELTKENFIQEDLLKICNLDYGNINKDE